MARTLTDRFVRTAAPGFYRDGGCPTLNLRVTPARTRQWVQRLAVHGRERQLGLGGYPLVPLAEAREQALSNRRLARAGGDPCALKRAQRAPTFAAAVDTVIAIHRDGWKGVGKSEAQWRASLRDYAMKRLGSKPVDRITTADVMAVLVPIWVEKHETARRVRQRISAVMQWAVAEGYRPDNPAGDAIGAALPKRNPPRVHHRALPFREVAGAVRAVRSSVRAGWATKAAFEFLVLTAARSGEVRGADWSEMNLEAGTWTIPRGRMKGAREHRVPLSDRALEILWEAHGHTGGTGLVFPTARHRPVSDSTLSKLLRELGVKAVPHGFRSSFRDWAAECTDAPREVCELALAHVNSDRVEAAYRRSDLFERRRALMQEWADYLA
ncbi:MAG: tyrosine-type recombinase/integrase [Gammaproteobacteria bacterium]|nr:tyrosine-type recombinase/integrase [Gammaproteobacteria bacterium]